MTTATTVAGIRPTGGEINKDNLVYEDGNTYEVQVDGTPYSVLKQDVDGLRQLLDWAQDNIG